MTRHDTTGRLAARLRSETDPAHRRLEANMGFDLENPSRASGFAMLRGFYGVLRQLEPAMLALVPAELAHGRDKLDLLRADLRAFGLTAAEIDALPSPRHPWLPTHHGEAIGALYVMEGSTLGGKVIAKALRQLPDWPMSGQSYFDPYGQRTGAMWTTFKAYLDGLAPGDDDAIVAAAQRTFSALDGWMVIRATA